MTTSTTTTAPRDPEAILMDAMKLIHGMLADQYICSDRAMCERIVVAAERAILEHANAKIGALASARAKEADQTKDDKWRAMAKALHEDEGTLEIDSNAIVSYGDDAGCYVAAWVWVPDEEAEKHLGDDLCGWCGHSDRIIDHIDGDGKTVCTKCAEQEDNEEQQEAA